MSGLRNKNTARFHSDKQQSERASRANILFISQNITAFKIKATKTDLIAFENFKNQIEVFTDKQKSYIDCMYEKTMGGLGLPAYKGIKSKYGVRLWY